MVNPITAGNGIIPITTAPPDDVAPTIPGYGVSVGVIEQTLPELSLPPTLFDAGLLEYEVTYAFEEYAIVLEGGQLTKIPLTGLTIDWSSSDLSQSGVIDAQFGVSLHYDLVGRSFTTFQYTYLDFECALTENGVVKSDSWTVRMKHY